MFLRPDNGGQARGQTPCPMLFSMLLGKQPWPGGLGLGGEMARPRTTRAQPQASRPGLLSVVRPFLKNVIRPFLEHGPLVGGEASSDNLVDPHSAIRKPANRSDRRIQGGEYDSCAGCDASIGYACGGGVRALLLVGYIIVNTCPPLSAPVVAADARFAEPCPHLAFQWSPEMNIQEVPDVAELSTQLAADNVRVNRFLDSLTGRIDELAHAARNGDWKEVRRISDFIARTSVHYGCLNISEQAEQVRSASEPPSDVLELKRSVLRLIAAYGHASTRQASDAVDAGV